MTIRTFRPQKRKHFNSPIHEVIHVSRKVIRGYRTYSSRPKSSK